MNVRKISLSLLVAIMSCLGIEGDLLQAEPLAVVQDNDLCGIIDNKGKFLVPLGYEQIVPWENGALIVKKGELCGVLRRDGREIVPVKYISILIPNHGNTYLVEDNEAHWGAYSSEGEVVLPMVYDEITAVTKSNDCFGVRQGAAWRFVHRDGSSWGTEVFDYIGEFGDELAVVKQQDKWGYATDKGEIALTPQYEGAQNFSGDYAAVKKQGKWGFINRQGIMKIQPQFREVYSGFSEGLAAVQAPTGKGYIDRQGNLLLPRDSRYIGPFKDGVAEIHEVKKKLNVWKTLAYGASVAMGSIGLPSKNTLKSSEKRGYINRRGEEIVATSYDEVLPFADGMSLVRKDKKWGAVSFDGKTTIRPQFDEMRPFGEGVAAVCREKRWQLIDKNGQVIEELPPEVTDTGVRSAGLLPVCISGKWGYMNKAGEIVISPRFRQVGIFTDEPGR
ncbi:MAG: WG repeat-containing protein [Selenomonas sp.]|uniref:WG repeat-containing protein n=1 Tax=Selenomonas sp. TaxID=2053611 RepID=UPI002600EE83|nr:WG repeat-containing protein [Selenomonas sp.]MCR5439741.1 WG repeat-containing protein [Selenomonas sp.]